MPEAKTERTVVSFRVSADEYKTLEQAASDADETVSEFVRKAVMMRATGGWPVRILANTSYMAPYMSAQIVPEQTSSVQRPVQEEYTRQV